MAMNNVILPSAGQGCTLCREQWPAGGGAGEGGGAVRRSAAVHEFLAAAVVQVILRIDFCGIRAHKIQTDASLHLATPLFLQLIAAVLASAASSAPSSSSAFSRTDHPSHWTARRPTVALSYAAFHMVSPTTALTSRVRHGTLLVNMGRINPSPTLCATADSAAAPHRNRSQARRAVRCGECVSRSRKISSLTADAIDFCTLHLDVTIAPFASQARVALCGVGSACGAYGDWFTSSRAQSLGRWVKGEHAALAAQRQWPSTLDLPAVRSLYIIHQMT
ncbi:hypothetical protein C8R45DRAFT_1167670 [Mycena sanguinolenta]|nr:hypothetical protein C8R45DRAFT_1167670 [Mycena sanguinolenta]